MRRYYIKPGDYLKAGTHTYIAFRLEDFYEALSKVNKTLYNDEEGSYDWNEALLKELELD